MRNTLALFFFVLMTMSSYAQISFEKNTTWDQVIAKAKAEKKLVFVDCYTTWCGPCKWLDKNTFQDKEVGEFYNANFVNLKVQMDTTKDDSDYTRAWRETANMIDAKYKILAYPSFLIFDGDGNLVDRGVGASPAKEFLALGKDMMDPSKRYFALKEAFEKGERNPEKVLTLAKRSLNIDRAFAPTVVDEYLKTQKDWLTEDNLKLMFSVTSKRGSDIHKFIENNDVKIGEILKVPNAAGDYFYNVANGHLIAKKISKKVADVDWNLLKDSLQMFYPKYANQFLLKAQITRASSKEDWPALVKAISSLKDKYASLLPLSAMNSYSWNLFEKCNDKTCLEKAANWMKAATTEKELSSAYLDTYANLLYKIGKKEEAIKVETQALDIAKAAGEDTTEYQNVLIKMNKGENTWE